MGDVRALRPGGKITKADLIELGQHEELEGAMVVCFWNDGVSTIGWTDDLKHGALVFGSKQLELEVNDRVFPHRHNSDEIDY